MASIPTDYRPLEGSQRKPRPGSTLVGPADPDEKLTISIHLRRPPDAPPLPDQKHWAATPPGRRKYATREEMARVQSATALDLQKVEEFARTHGFRIVQSSSGRRLVQIAGTVRQANKAFAAELVRFHSPTAKERYRTHLEPVHLPADLQGIVVGVFGLDNRRMARHLYDGPPTLGPRHNYAPGIYREMGIREVAALYGFPLDPRNGNAAGQTVAVLEFSGPGYDYPTTGLAQSDVNGFVANLLGPSFNAPTIGNVSIDGAPIQPGMGYWLFGTPDVEVALDIEVVVAVAQGASVVAYYAPMTEQGWADAISYIVYDSANSPNVLSISYGWPEIETAGSEGTWPFAWTAMAVQTVSSWFQQASAVGMTILVASGDTGSFCDQAPGSGPGAMPAVVGYPASDPWVVSCGGTTLLNVQDPLGMTFDEVTWNDDRGATGGGVSEINPLPFWQSGAGVPTSLNSGFAGRGLPDIAGNASPYSGYDLWLFGAQTLGVFGPGTGIAGGTSAVAPLYASLIAILNSKLGFSLGYLNPMLYALGGTPVFNDIDDGANNQYQNTNCLSFSSGPGWDACTGWGSIRGAKLLAALRSSTINAVDSTPTTPAVCVLDGALYLFWKANDSGNEIFYSASSDGLTWPAGQVINGTDSTPQALACCVFGGGQNPAIYLFWPANDPSASIYYTSSPLSELAQPMSAAGNWTAGQTIDGVDTTQLALAVCQSVDGTTIDLFWTNGGSSPTVYFSTTGDFGVPWPQGTETGSVYDGVLTPFVAATGPAVCVFQNTVYMFWTTSDGSVVGAQSDAGSDPPPWNAAFMVQPTGWPTVPTTAPAACVFNDTIFVFWTYASTIWFCSLGVGGAWSAPTQIDLGAQTTQSPAACAFNGLLYVFWTDDLNTSRIRFAISADGITWT